MAHLEFDASRGPVDPSHMRQRRPSAEVAWLAAAHDVQVPKLNSLSAVPVLSRNPGAHAHSVESSTPREFAGHTEHKRLRARGVRGGRFSERECCEDSGLEYGKTSKPFQRARMMFSGHSHPLKSKNEPADSQLSS